MASPSSNEGYNPVEVDPSERYLRYDMIIGEGATKKVYLGFDRNDGKEVTWSKTDLTPEMLANEDLLESLYAEAELLKSLRHENVVRCFHSWIDKEEKVINMITEFFPSGNLGEFFRRYKTDNISVIKNWCTQILKGLKYLHSFRIVHRDLSFDNIFFDGILGTVKIGDLGLTLFYEQEGAMQSFSCRPEFVAPELLQGEGSYSQLIDIYSFGMCVLQMVTRETPYSECTNKQHIYAMVRAGEMPVALSKVVVPVVKQFIEKCLRPASDRPTASALLKDSFLRSSDLSTEAGSGSQSMSESVGEQPDTSQVQVQPRSFRLKGKSVDSGPFKMTLYSDNGRVDFDFSVENDTTQEVMKRIETEEGLSNMSTVEFALLSELMEQLITELKSSEGPRVKLLEITCEERKVKPVFRVTTTPQPEVTDTMQQPEDTMQQPEVMDTMQQPEVIDMHID